MPRKLPYHHGDLRNALLRAGLDILEADGLAALSLRGVAARVGVSHAAPAHHFGNLAHLLTALATIAFERLAAAMARARASADNKPIEQMRAAGRGYWAFARDNPALFRLMFSSAQFDLSDGALQSAAAAARRHLVEISEPAATAFGADSATDRSEIEKLVWSSIHGYAHLALEGQFGADRAGAGEPPDVARILFASAPVEAGL